MPTMVSGILDEGAEVVGTSADPFPHLQRSVRQPLSRKIQ